MESTPPESFSRIPLQVNVIGKGKVKGEIIKHLAPSTSGSIIRRGKVSGRVTIEGNSAVILTNIKAGPEKQKSQFSAGDIAFLPLNGALCIFLANSFAPRPMNQIGKVNSDSAVLKKISRGDTIVFEVEGAPQSVPPQ